MFSSNHDHGKTWCDHEKTWHDHGKTWKNMSIVVDNIEKVVRSRQKSAEVIKNAYKDSCLSGFDVYFSVLIPSSR